MTLGDWYAHGTRAPLRVASGSWAIFTRSDGRGPWCTLFHGFPTSSWDWHAVWPAIVARREALAFDFLGFGDSDKPRNHTYSIHEQADLAVAVWRRHAVTHTDLVVHDYGVSVAQEILARHAEGSLGVELMSVTFLNGGVYPDLHRPQPSQLMLLDPEQGPKLADLITAETFARALGATYAPERQPSIAELGDQWHTVAMHDGHRIGHLLETTRVPRHFIWGMLDPVSGAHMMARIAERMPDADIVRLADVAHWPQLEDPETVRTHLERILR